MKPALAAVPILAACLATAALAQVTTTVVDIPSRGGTQRFLHVAPPNAVATIVSLSGGDGVLGIQDSGAMITTVAQCNPLNKVRDALAARGYALAFVDAHSSGSVRNFADAVAVIDYLRARNDVPTWVAGGSAATGIAANLAANLPAEYRAGAIVYSPGQPSGLVPLITRPTLVIYHLLDTGQSSSAFFNALTGTAVKERIGLNGGSNAGCGHHLFNGVEAAFGTAVGDFIATHNAFAPAAPNFQGLWYRAPAESEAGWGVNVAHQGDILFATWFTYDADGSQMWLVGPDVRRTTGNTYAGTLYRTTGPAFDSVPFNPAQVGATPVGTVGFSFTDSNNGTFTATVNGTTVSKPITRQVFSTLPTCTAGGAQGATPNFQDLWYRAPAESEAGWGVNLTHQGDILFATWFTYDATGRGMWIVGPDVRRTTGNTFSGTLYRTTGPAFDANPWSPAGVGATPVGSATFAFTGASSGTFTYTVGGVTQSKAITRQVFGTPVTVCR